ncbi:NHLP-related RiPP peptide [uncultured Stenotrophomonas sp.]|uniref:NHLP-related RiPP peptide n=1 Tax=uncultured Stenotrophomonas sp. TaxID=165438 RepID=UPI0025E0AC2B|nr:NHLP-related RiPP peptide [uncultured Stenotrophomonas sp.]
MSNEKSLLSQEDAVKLLDLLSTDDAFRELFAASPSQALQQISASAAASSCTCETTGPLASKAEFMRSRDALLAHLAANAAFYIPHCFVSGQVDSSLQRKPQI